MSLFRRCSFDTPCRIEVEHSDRYLCAHVDLADGVRVNPGDQVRVHGDPIAVAFGERRVFERVATVRRAGRLERLWTKVLGHFALTELYELSFSDRTVP